jgi:hypothetical protein
VTTRAGLRALVRNELNDNANIKLWADADLNQWIGEAITEYSYQLPKEASTTLTSIAGTDTYAVPADLIRFQRVRQPKSQLRQLGELAAYGYLVFAGSLILDPAPGATGGDQNIFLDYLARYPLPSADGDTLATPTADDRVLVDLVCAKAMSWIDTDEVKRQRFERLRALTARSLAESYQQKASAAIATRKRAVRFRQLTEA